MIGRTQQFAADQPFLPMFPQDLHEFHTFALSG
jgi:hypothetical protein